VALYRDHGIVLRTYKLGEADRIIVLVTEHHGKVRAVAKGVRKTKSKFGSRLEPVSHVAVQLYERRELDIVTQVESVDHFRAIRDDLDRLGRAASMLEAVDQLALEREPNPALYRMLLGGLRTLASRDSELVTAGFFWKLLSLEGFRPVVDACVVCGATSGLVAGAGAGRLAVSLILSRMPINAQLASTEEPPYATKGSVIPVSGMRPMTPPATTKTWSAKAPDRPTASSLPNGSRAASAVRTPRSTISP